MTDLGTAAAKLGGVVGSTDGGRVRTAAVLAGLDLAHAVALVNGTYFHHGPKGMVGELEAMRAPAEFASWFVAALTAIDPEEARRRTTRLLQATAAFLDVAAPPVPASPSLATKPTPYRSGAADAPALAHLYEEIVSSFVKVRNRCASGDAVHAAIDALLLQRILDEDVPPGVDLPSLVEAFDPADLGPLLGRADLIDRALRHTITEAGGQIERYPDPDTFLQANP